ncbi:protein of unknown function DUF710 [Alkaliphilus metalliredigens QYMF]|uniref:Cell division protein ZapA n=1 Tax=Alkaliphilus metalliredigens (strain QYMF) TaxID=293826 RepID=A6TNQ0_ALKMQ|nr:cell division protein ZapA [Alkaliphilus metalliredigens]ABR47818.1 protein of unknown function DUF710 [Alkaliphilus metalliredigens QYMF]
MEKKNKVVVKIKGQEYPILGEEPKEYLLRVGNFVDERMEEIAKANSKLSTSMAAVLTSINIADQFLKLKMEVDTVEKEYVGPLKDLDNIKGQLTSALEQVEERKAYCNVLEEKVDSLTQSHKSYDEENKSMKEKLTQKETDLAKTQEIINGLQNKLFENQIKLVQARKELDEVIQKGDYQKTKDNKRES